MPKFTLPALPKPKKNKGLSVPEMEPDIYPDKWQRTISVPVTKEILAGLKVGQTLDVKLSGKITTLENREVEKGKNRAELTIELSAVETANDDMAAVFEDDD